MEYRTIATGLRFPEGPIAMPDGSVILVEIERGTLSRVRPEGTVEVVAETGGGPNGAAMGPDGRCYVCNNGGFEWHYQEDGPGMRSIGQAAAPSADDARRLRAAKCAAATLVTSGQGIGG